MSVHATSTYLLKPINSHGSKIEKESISKTFTLNLHILDFKLTQPLFWSRHSADSISIKFLQHFEVVIKILMATNF